MAAAELSAGLKAAAALVALAALAQRLGPHRLWPMGEGADLPHFALCETAYGWPCRRWVPVRWLEDFYEALVARAGEVAESGSTPVVLHVGAANFKADLVEYRPLLKAIRSRGRVRLVLVEPEMEHRDVLLRRHIDLGMEAADITVVSAAMNGTCSETTVQYVFSDQLFSDFVVGDLHTKNTVRSSLRSWRSFRRDRLLATVEHVGTKEKFLTGEGSARHWDVYHRVVVPVVRRIYQAGNYSDYIVEERIHCLTASDLMTQAELRPEDIVMATIDAEGFDIPILKSLIGLEGFRPTLQRWEGNVSHVADRAVAEWFLAHGYKIGMSGYSHSVDVIAYRGSPV